MRSITVEGADTLGPLLKAWKGLDGTGLSKIITFSDFNPYQDHRKTKWPLEKQRVKESPSRYDIY
jgi:hypothetical protein